jgi:hypothetical protein
MMTLLPAVVLKKNMNREKVSQILQENNPELARKYGVRWKDIDRIIHNYRKDGKA